MVYRADNQTVMQRMVRTALLIEPFWERWLVHGVDIKDLQEVKAGLASPDDWVARWCRAAGSLEDEAAKHAVSGSYPIAEALYRRSSLYFNLAQWIYPERCEEKEQRYADCLRTMRFADSLSEHSVAYDSLEVEGHRCYGRIIVPSPKKGCIIIIVPIDSSKEELYRYEQDFLNAGYAVVSFDGPGQGETYTFGGLKGYKKRWEDFVHDVIGYAADMFPQLPLFLFGTSLGGSWALYGSGHPRISATAVVSPAVTFEKLRLPEYFLERMDRSCTLEAEHRAIPEYEMLTYKAPVLLFHGMKDQMVVTHDMYELYESIKAPKNIVEYEDEGHCANNRLDEIRHRSIQWFNQHT